MKTELEALRALARALGIRMAYDDAAGRRRVATIEALLGTVRALGAEVERPSDAPAALAEHERSRWHRLLPPVAVVWDGSRTTVRMRLRSSALSRPAVYRAELEDGSAVERSFRPRTLPVAASTRSGRQTLVEVRLDLPGPWPHGYHRLRVEADGRATSCRILSAPRRAFGAAPSNAEPIWGLFAPLYALRSERNWGVGDFADLATLADWAGVQGGRVVATLPLLASFLDRPFEPGPYRPVSRLFWNELFVAVDRTPELEVPSSTRFPGHLGRELEGLRDSPEVHYRRVMAVKRRVLGRMASRVLTDRGTQRDAFDRFIADRPEVERYARFRATVEKRRETWSAWPERLRDGRLQAGDFDENAARYHAYVQWLAAEQLQAAARRAGENGPGLGLDFPLGVHPEGFDVWSEPELFARNASAGAPPDDFHARGQAWGSPPIRPDRSREQGHAYLAACLRHHMAPAGLLRLDHVMALHRLFWIPQGLEPEQGVYVRYPADELYALVSIESHRGRCLVVGEDLGTVPGEVRPALRKHNLRRTYVLQFSLGNGKLRNPDADAVAVLSTHDMPPFASFRRGMDIGERARIGLVDRETARRQRRQRREALETLIRALRDAGLAVGAKSSAEQVLRACLAHLAAGAPHVVLANLEDLWLETRAQNVPGTTTERSNWRGKARYALEELSGLPRVSRTLREIDRLRRRALEASG